MVATMKVDQVKLEALVGQAVGEFGAIISSALVVIGDRLGLYRTLAESGPLSTSELAERTGTAEAYVHPWLVNQAAGGYVTYNELTERFSLSPEQAVALTDESSPFYIGGGFQVMTAAVKAEAQIADRFLSGGGFEWGEHDHNLFQGTERFFRPGYEANLVQQWIPALDGVEEKLNRGAMVADIGCGHGITTLIMANAFPQSKFFGFDFHGPSIERARVLAAEMGLADRVVFDVADAGSFPGTEYDLITYFDCLHDLGAPLKAIAHARNVIMPNGHLLIVEPMAGESDSENLNPIGRIYSGASVLICTPNALATGDSALGTIATEKSLRSVVNGGGFTGFRRAMQTPLNRIFEARP